MFDCMKPPTSPSFSENIADVIILLNVNIKVDQYTQNERGKYIFIITTILILKTQKHVTFETKFYGIIFSNSALERP